MEKVSAYEAKTHLPRLLREVARGKKLWITKRGAPIAILSPIEEKVEKNPKDVIESLRHFRKGLFLGGLSVRDMIHEGRRF